MAMSIEAITDFVLKLGPAALGISFLYVAEKLIAPKKPIQDGLVIARRVAYVSCYVGTLALFSSYAFWWIRNHEPLHLRDYVGGEICNIPGSFVLEPDLGRSNIYTLQQMITHSSTYSWRLFVPEYVIGKYDSPPALLAFNILKKSAQDSSGKKGESSSQAWQGKISIDGEDWKLAENSKLNFSFVYKPKKMGHLRFISIT
jgi:hypothetical protein